MPTLLPERALVMVSGIKLSFHKQIFLALMVFAWGMLLCFVAFQYLREKEYKSAFLNAQLQQYNQHLLQGTLNGTPYTDYIALHEKPFEELRISIILPNGTVLYDNTLPAHTLGNHSNRPEVAEAIAKGQGYSIGRLSASDSREYFYSATKGEQFLVRTAIPYSSTLRDLLAADWSFLLIMTSITLAMSLVAYFVTRKIGHDMEKVNLYTAEQEKNRIKRQLTNNINHELKTPVASIQVCLETLLSGITLSEEKRRDLIGRCYAHNERLRQLLEDVSLITRMEDGKHMINREPVDINHIVQEIAEELEVLPPEERLHLHAHLSPKVVVNGDPSLIGSIFSNLTENAIAYSEGKNIYISLLEESQELYKIRFEDDGKGVAPEQLPRLFERFYRVDKGRSRKKGGTGLGLAIVKHAVMCHGGNIQVSNRPEGGLRFDFSLRK